MPSLTTHLVRTPLQLPDRLEQLARRARVIVQQLAVPDRSDDSCPEQESDESEREEEFSLESVRTGRTRVHQTDPPLNAPTGLRTRATGVVGKWVSDSFGGNFGADETGSDSTFDTTGWCCGASVVETTELTDLVLCRRTVRCITGCQHSRRRQDIARAICTGAGEDIVIPRQKRDGGPFYLPLTLSLACLSFPFSFTSYSATRRETICPGSLSTWDSLSTFRRTSPNWPVAASYWWTIQQWVQNGHRKTKTQDKRARSESDNASGTSERFRFKTGQEDPVEHGTTTRTGQADHPTEVRRVDHGSG